VDASTTSAAAPSSCAHSQFTAVTHDERVLAFHRFRGRGKASGIEVAQTGPKGACLFYIRDGKVTKLLLYSVHDRAVADLGLAPDTGT
jgi:hypothetical protein